MGRQGLVSCAGFSVFYLRSEWFESGSTAVMRESTLAGTFLNGVQQKLRHWIPVKLTGAARLPTAFTVDIWPPIMNERCTSPADTSRTEWNAWFTGTKR